MGAEIIDLETRRASALKAGLATFVRLPCPVCDQVVAPNGIEQGHARYTCDNGGCHPVATWTYDGRETVCDQAGRKRRFFSY